MSTDTIFGEKPVTPEARVENTTDYTGLLGMIINEQGEQKYKSVEEALKGASHAQTYIRQMQADKAALEARLQAAEAAQSKEAELERTLQELLAKQGATSSQTTPELPKSDDIAAIVLKQLEARETEAKSKVNQQAVAAALLEKFGTEAEAKYNEAANELGLTVAEMNAMAAKSPKAVLKALGVEQKGVVKSNTFTPGQSAVNTSAFTPSQESFVKRNTERNPIGITTRELNEESKRARAMVDEIHNAGMSIHDLTDPKVFFKHFK